MCTTLSSDNQIICSDHYSSGAHHFISENQVWQNKYSPVWLGVWERVVRKEPVDCGHFCFLRNHIVRYKTSTSCLRKLAARPTVIASATATTATNDPLDETVHTEPLSDISSEQRRGRTRGSSTDSRVQLSKDVLRWRRAPLCGPIQDWGPHGLNGESNL